ncbi:hypothetical protein [Micromonospora sp. NPDC047738]|uniref:hypothetical protein n=1 Tax=unclassified Micromonospora TaxID=2617518 RepID=UPI0033ED6AFA
MAVRPPGRRGDAVAGFFGAALNFPTVLFSFLLLVVVGYWLLVPTGVLDLGDDLDVEALRTGATPCGNCPPIDQRIVDRQC